MKLRTLAAGVGAVLLGLLAAAALTVPARGAAADGAFTDPTGDVTLSAGVTSGPDISSAVLHDDGTLLTFTANLAAGLPANAAVLVQIDADRSTATGDNLGFDYVFAAITAADGSLAQGILRWDGTSDQPVVSPTAKAFASTAHDAFTWQVARSDLGGSRGFDFNVIAVSFTSDGSAIASADIAPDSPGGTLSYDFQAAGTTTTTTTATTTTKPPPARALLGAAHVAPVTVHAGKHAVVTFPVSTSDGSPLAGATLQAHATVAGKTVARTVKLQGGAAHVGVTLPKTSKGKRLAVTATVRFHGRSVARSASYLIH